MPEIQERTQRKRKTRLVKKAKEQQSANGLYRVLAKKAATRKSFETIYLRCGGKIVIPLSPIRRAGFDIDRVFAGLVSRDLIGRTENFYFAYCGFEDPGRSDAPDAFNAFDLTDEFLSFALPSVNPLYLHNTAGRA
ncbi:MAG: hypothetical protein WBX25_29110 [Rhodomicrobium sp.]